ncbi:MAG: hypothetical protein IT492_23060 [Gammaproteobacteria bacterium]|nr:hypothetical protein [Gammaproteobacteria bacterium]
MMVMVSAAASNENRRAPRLVGRRDTRLCTALEAAIGANVTVCDKVPGMKMGIVATVSKREKVVHARQWRS